MDLPESSNRKRHRAVSDDEISEFTPLSKRINNLHINNSFLTFLKPLEPNNTQLKPEMHRAMVHEKLADYGCGGSRNMDSDVGLQPLDWGANYSPDLTPAENPFYYESNRVLYELYQERARRSNLPSTSSGHF